MMCFNERRGGKNLRGHIITTDTEELNGGNSEIDWIMRLGL
jgi:hypothetical protein